MIIADKKIMPQIVFSARHGDYAEASSLLNRLMLDISKSLSSGKISPTEMNSVLQILQNIFAAQKSQDWVRIADIIEFDLTKIGQTA